MKIHYTPRTRDYNSLTEKEDWFYNLFSACGILSVLNSTHVKKKVTCKNCLRVINAKKHNHKTFCV